MYNICGVHTINWVYLLKREGQIMQIDKQVEEIFEGAQQVMKDYEEILDILKQLHEEEEDTFIVYTSEQDTEELYEPWIIPIY